MNKITKRIVASLSAAALIVSTFGSNSFSGTMMDSVYAEESATSTSNRKGRSTGFDNLEQDTDGEYYNTGYGLHTNKTASVAEGSTDGRTFDVNLESWYVGENPVDIATILDASGSMAWTVDTLDPLKIDEKEATELRKIQETNGGYLPEDVIEGILNPDYTDNTKLSYSDYLYYVYDARSSVSEFVPLGFWDGGITDNLIGYYPLNGNLNNEVNGESATAIRNVNSKNAGSGLFSDEETMVNATPDYSSDVAKHAEIINLAETASNGAILLDVKKEDLLKNGNFSVLFQTKVNSTSISYGDSKTDIIYIGSLINTKNGLRIYFDESGDLMVSYNDWSEKLGTSKATMGWQTFKLVVSDSELKFTVGRNEFITINLDSEFDLDAIDDFGIVVGGFFDQTKYSGIDNLILDNVYIFNDALSQADVYKLEGYTEDNKTNKKDHFSRDNSADVIKDNLNDYGDKIVGLYSFDSNSLANKATSASGAVASYIAQNSGSGFVPESVPTQIEASAEYSSDGKSLSLNNTCKKGVAVKLDVTPSPEHYTISFDVMISNTDATGAEGNVLYVGDNNTKDNAYYFAYRAEAGSKNHFRIKEKGDTSQLWSKDNFFQNKSGIWQTVTYVVNGNSITAYIDGNDSSSGSLKLVYKDPLSIVLGGLWDDGYNRDDIFVKNVYVFDKALSEAEVAACFGNAAVETCQTDADKNNNRHALQNIKDETGTINKTSVAQITTGLAESEAYYRRGWYYVNSHSSWTDISGCLESGKQYIGVKNDPYLGEKATKEKLQEATGNDTGNGIKDGANDSVKDTDNKSWATIPSAWALAHDLLDKKNSGTLTPEEEKTLGKIGEETAQKYDDYYNNISAGNDTGKTFDSPSTERSIRFYVDSQGYLRCFFNTGDTSWKVSSKQWNYEPRTFCSLVYTNEGIEPKVDSKDTSVAGKVAQQEAELKKITDSAGKVSYRASITKYERLNVALNVFFEQLAENSDLTNTAVVRYSTNKVADGSKSHFDELVMQDWTSWSSYYQEIKQDTGGDADKNSFLQNLLIPASGETSISSVNGQYPYVMTGGTYTWTALKSFYENMVKENVADSINKDIATDGREKYLIIFTDGRDNTQDITLSSDGKTVESYGSSYKKQDYLDQSPAGVSVKNDGELAKAWADKLKDEGYTIYCVMMATGSVSQTANEAEYNKAYYFLKTLAGASEGDERDLTAQPDDVVSNYVRVTEASSTNIDDSAVGAFQAILADIQQPRSDYTVQDYIDPRFNLIDADGNLYNLGAGGKITVTDKSGDPVTSLTLSSGTTPGGSVTVGNVIGVNDGLSSEELRKGTDKTNTITGLAYTPLKSEMVNRKEDPKGGYDNGDKGTGYIYYDNEKDMYYLRWTEQIIPMADQSFDTDDTHENLDVWSATIRLKAKDDFIGGNNILTNGNEAGENLVFSTKTLDLMRDDWDEYTGYGGDYENLTADYSERAALQTLSGTNRKINAVDADGVSQSVYGNGMNVPSSGFPRVVVNVRLLPITTNPLKDVIYMGEVLSPTMMLADIEDDYMSGSYYLQYLERYAYRLYGYNAGETPLIELLNQWLKINDENATEKTFTIPYMYLPEPEYNEDGTLQVDGGVVKVGNNTGMSTINQSGYTIADFDDPNLCDVTGFITYTWKREGDDEPQQYDPALNENKGGYDIIREYVVKDTKQIQYNLKLEFTPLQKNPIGVSLENNKFINPSSVPFDGGERFFRVETTEGATDIYEFTDSGKTVGEELKAWEFANRSDYLKAMVKEEHIFKPPVAYDDTENKWKFVGEIVLPNGKTITGIDIDDALSFYAENDQTTTDLSSEMVTNKGVYDWDVDYKPAEGSPQLEYEKWENDHGYYGNAEIEDFVKGTTKVEHCTLSANTTYTKDVVNGALALELVVDGKYLKGTDPEIKAGKEYTFTATRSYDDPYDPLPYGGNENYVNADTGIDPIDTSSGNYNKGAGDGQQYQLTFKVDKEGSPKSIPNDPQDGEFYTILAYLDTVKVDSIDGYAPITETGYTDADALPIGTYKIDVNNIDTDRQYYIGNSDGTDLYFKYLKVDSTPSSYIYNRFPESVYSVSETAKKSTNDSEYLIWDETTDNASKNIAKNNRIKDTDMQTLNFYFGTVEKRTINGKELNNTIGYSRNDKSTEAKGNDYAKDRLGIILLSADLNNLFISKEVTHTNSETEKYITRPWEFTVTFMPPADAASKDEFIEANNKGFTLTWYRRDDSSNPWKVESAPPATGYPDGSGGTKAYPETIKFDGPDGDGKYTATIYLRHNEKVLINSLPDGAWQVIEKDERSVGDKILYSAHNDMDNVDDYSWSNKTLELPSLPGAGVQFTNQFPFYILSAGGSGTYLYVMCGGLLILMASLLYYLSRLRKSKSRDKPDG